MCNINYFNYSCTKNNEIILFRQTTVLIPVSPLLVHQMIAIFQICFVRSKSKLHQQVKALLTLYLLTAAIIYSFLNPNPDRQRTGSDMKSSWIKIQLRAKLHRRNISSIKIRLIYSVWICGIAAIAPDPCPREGSGRSTVRHGSDPEIRTLR